MATYLLLLDSSRAVGADCVRGATERVALATTAEPTLGRTIVIDRPIVPSTGAEAGAGYSSIVINLNIAPR